VLDADLIYIAGVLAVCGILAYGAYLKRVLDLKGTVMGFIMGVLIGVFGHLTWVVLLLLFLITSFAATKYRYEFKKKRKVAESKGGMRGFQNVVANGVIPTVVSVLSASPFPDFTLEKGVAAVMFLSALSAAASDTIASEIGVFSSDVYLITNLKKRVDPGVNGGVSLLGTGAALGAAFYMSLTGYLVMHHMGGFYPAGLWYIPLAVGFAGTHIDSVLGALFENRGYMSGSDVNLITTFICALLAYAWMYA